MSLLTNTSPLALWQDVVKSAENRCSINLCAELETYLVALLIRYSNRPELVKQILATTYLEALQQQSKLREICLQEVGDQCLIFAGLFPKLAERRHVKITYFVDLGRSAYSAVSQCSNDLFNSLALQFVMLMDVLQSIRYPNEMTPLEAYTQWQELDSQYAFQTLLSLTKGLPIKGFTRQ